MELGCRDGKFSSTEMIAGIGGGRMSETDVKRAKVKVKVKCELDRVHVCCTFVRSVV